jgi:hypothetical protein
MPIYEYRCEKCHRRVSVLVKRMGEEAGPELGQAIEEMESGGAGAADDAPSALPAYTAPHARMPR